MYELIKDLCVAKGISPTKLCTEITGSKGNLPTWQKGNINPKSLIKIADYFNVSVLGRTDNPQGISQINTGNVGDNSNVNINNAEKEKATCSDSDKTTSELVAVFNDLSLGDKAKVMSLVAELSKRKA